jgi:hypothetical protein
LHRVYTALLEEIKARIRQSQVKAAFSVNRELIALNGHIDQSIVERKCTETWRKKAVVVQPAADLQREFPTGAGFSVQNIWYMMAFYLA